MRRLTKILTTTVFSATLIASSLQLSFAAPMHVIQPQFEAKTGQTILKIGHRAHRRGRHVHRHPRRHSRHYRRHHRHDNPWPYIIGGIIIGGIILNANKHHSWCRNHYRSYEQRSNTFQPFHGPRRQCVSPYFH